MTWPCTLSLCTSSSPFVGRTSRVRGAASSADHESGLPGRPPEREASLLVGEERTMNGPVEYLAIAFASRDAAIAARLRVSVAELVPEARVVRSLDAYLRLHGSLNAVARDLYLHRNTVRQRLRRITKLTGADLKNADSRLALQLALLGRSALERLAS